MLWMMVEYVKHGKKKKWMVETIVVNEAKRILKQNN
jgi:hypothetical protein